MMVNAFLFPALCPPIFLLLTPSKLHLSFYRDMFIECTFLPPSAFLSPPCSQLLPVYSFPSIWLLLLSVEPPLLLLGLMVSFCSLKEQM